MKRDCIFISYSHKLRGPEWKRLLITQLAFFEKHGLIAAWDDEQIPAGARWEKEIADAIHNARLAVILLTKEALESEFILQRELVPLQQREKDGVIVIPVNCGCEGKEYENHDWIKTLQIRPFEAKPLSTIADEAELQRVFRRLATEIAEELGRSALAQIPLATTEPGVVREYLDKFPLTRGPSLREEKLIGREQELALLNLAFAQPHTAFVTLVAWGGVGKTMLVQHWLQRLQREGWFGVRRVYAWSFYSQGAKEDRQASEDMFLAHALEWFGVQCEPTLSPWDKGRLLADAVARERTLLILDGIEPLQYPPGPMGGQLRAPGVQSLLKQLARKAPALNSQPSTLNQALCLVTTREPLTDLVDFQRREGSPWGSVLRVDLGNLTDEAGAALLHHAGANRAGAAEIKTDDKELLAASREVDGHALTLNLLGRFLARAHSGDVRHRDLVKFEEADRKEQGGTTFKMLAAFESWFARSGEFGARQLAVLRILGLFDRPADVGCIGTLRKPPVIAGLTDPLFTTKLDANTGQASVQPLLEEDWNTATSFLADFGLIVIQTDNDNHQHLLDCHPLIREHFANCFRVTNNEMWKSGHRRLYKHLANKSDYQPDTLGDLQPLYQAVWHGCQGGLYENALTDVFLERIQRYVKGGDPFYPAKKLGAIDADLVATASFFETPWETPVESLPPKARYWLLGQAGYYLNALGRVTEALATLRSALAGYIQEEQWLQATVASRNLGDLRVDIGDLPSAINDAKQAMLFADRTTSASDKMFGRANYAHVLALTGRSTEAKENFCEAERMQATNEPRFPLLYSAEGFMYCAFILADPERNAWRCMLREAALTQNRPSLESSLALCRSVEQRGEQMLLWRLSCDSVFTIARDALTMSHAKILRSVLSMLETDRAAALHEGGLSLAEALKGLLSSGQRNALPAGLNLRAWFRILNGDTAAARADLDEAWDIAERGPMRLHMADILLHRARLFFREKAYPWKSPQEDLAAAEKLIHDCGYHRRDEELADAKRAILGTA